MAAKFEAKIFALPDEVEITSGPLIRLGIVALPLLKMLFVIRQNSGEPSLLFSILV